MAIANSPGLEALVAKVIATKLPPPAERRRIFRRAGVSLREAAKVIDVSAMSLSRWQRGTCEPRDDDDAAAYKQLLERLREAAQ